MRNEKNSARCVMSRLGIRCLPYGSAIMRLSCDLPVRPQIDGASSLAMLCDRVSKWSQDSNEHFNLINQVRYAVHSRGILIAISHHLQGPNWGRFRVNSGTKGGPFGVNNHCNVIVHHLPEQESAAMLRSSVAPLCPLTQWSPRRRRVCVESPCSPRAGNDLVLTDKFRSEWTNREC